MMFNFHDGERSLPTSSRRSCAYLASSRHMEARHASAPAMFQDLEELRYRHQYPSRVIQLAQPSTQLTGATFTKLKC